MREKGEEEKEEIEKMLEMDVPIGISDYSAATDLCRLFERAESGTKNN
jgi:hypothetical protein